MTPNPNQPYVGANAFAHKGGIHAAGNQPRRAHVRAHRSGGGRGRPPRAGVRAVRQGHGAGAGPMWTIDDSRARIDRVKELESRGYQFEAADVSSISSSARRPAGTSRRSGSSRGARSWKSARTGEWRPRPRSRSGGRRALRADGRGERPGERAGQGAPRRDRRALPAPARHGARELQGADPGPAEGHQLGHAGAADTTDGQDTWGAIGVSENIIEASWEALVTRSRPACCWPNRVGRGQLV